MRNIGILGSMIQLKDIYASSSTIFDIVMTRLEENSPLEAIDGIAKDLIDGIPLVKESFDSYPSANMANENTCQKQFLGICRGRDLLEDTLSATKLWAQIADERFPSSETKSVLFLTDKWNDTFSAYDQPFRYLAMNKGFWFTFVLVTAHGITEIPFLPLELYRFTRH